MFLLFRHPFYSFFFVYFLFLTCYTIVSSFLKKGKKMSVIIDMQNHILDHKNGSYVAKAKTIIPKIAERLNSARQNGEYVLFTKDVPIRYKGTLTEENDSFQIISQLQPLAHEKVLQKYYYTLSPEILLDLKRTLFKSK